VSLEVLQVGPDACGVRLDQYLVRVRPELSRARIQALIEAGEVKIDNQVTKSSLRLKGSERIALTIPQPIAAEPQPEAIPLSVLHEDRDIVVLDKAAGMVVHPGAGHGSGTLVNALLHHIKDLRGVGGELRPGIVHRLDKDTSGLLVIAKHDQALRTLQQSFKSREVDKTYLALVDGQPPDLGTFSTLHARHPTQRLRFTGRLHTGKPAVTHFQVLERFPTAAKVQVSLETGRTHQIRMHFAEAGFPLLSDALYGTKRSSRPEVIERQALHAWKLSFAHPRTKKRVAFTAPLPKDLKRAARVLAEPSRPLAR
jgi:23S rRNA pseudouridine1911/1915/1917 synthase